MSNYFTSGQAELFSFYRLPKILFTNPKFCGISAEAKILYGLLLDRMSLSAKNGWLDYAGRVYIIFTVEEIMDSLACGNKKAVGLLRELEEKVHLIERKRQGLGKPNLIYVKNFADVSEEHFQKGQKDITGSVDLTLQEMSKEHSNKTNQNNTERNETDPFLSERGEGMRANKIDDRIRYQDYFEKQLKLGALTKEYPEDEEVLQEIQELLVDTVCSNRKMIRIAGDDKPSDVVKGRLMKLNTDHIRFVLLCMKENTTQVRNMRQYILAALYNAPLTMYNYYASQVQHDLNAK